LAGSSPAEKRAVIASLRADAPVAQLCDLFACARSTYYYRPVHRDESALLEAIEVVLMHQPWFGYRRVVAQLKREGWVTLHLYSGPHEKEEYTERGARNDGKKTNVQPGI
jgi:hypothetical protein